MTSAAPPADSVSTASRWEHRVWTIDGLEREAIVAAPPTASAQPTPLVFVFHGHGGRMQSIARSYQVPEAWPGAIVVVPQGVNTPGRLTDPQGNKTGWQTSPGDHADRDLRFVDAILESLRQEYQIDERRIYATGHSNGAGFCYLLWATRNDVFAAFGPSAGMIAPSIRNLIRPKAAIIIAGDQDPLVKIKGQRAMIAAIAQINRCKQQPVADGLLQIYDCESSTPLQTFVHPGGHRFEPAAVPAIFEFFKSQSLAEDLHR